MKQHPITGENICKPLRSFRNVLHIIRHHHEHCNGTGYPDGLKGNDIPLLARILQVVDVYDALRTERPYKPALSHAVARESMVQQVQEGLLDGELLKEFFAMLDEAKVAA
jgi:putative two-component system response regulator